jgi:hypothetical protein
MKNRLVFINTFNDCHFVVAPNGQRRTAAAETLVRDIERVLKKLKSLFKNSVFWKAVSSED